MNINIPFTPELLKWEELIRSEEYNFQDDKVVSELFQSGKYTRTEIGEILTVARHLDMLNPESEYRSDKGNFIHGAGHGAKLLADGFKRKYKVGLDGKVIRFRQSISVPPIKGEEVKERYIPTKSGEAIKAAEGYIFSKIKGNLVNYLAIITINEGDLDKVGRDIKKMVDEIIDSLK